MTLAAPAWCAVEIDNEVKAAFRRSKVTLTTQRNKRYRVDLKYSRMSGKFTLESSEADEERQPAAVA